MTYPLSSSESSNSAAPPRQALSSGIAQQSALASQLFNLISKSTQSTNPSIPAQITQLYKSLQASEGDLAKCVRDLWAHQAAYAEMERVKEEVKRLDGKVRNLLIQLETSRVELEAMVEKGKTQREEIDKVDKRPMDVVPLLAHARSLAKHSSAPVSALLAPVDKAQWQPWPTETSMRGGILFREGGNMSTLGDVGIIGQTEAVPQDELMPEETYQYQEEQPQAAPAVFSLDLNSDDSDDD